MHNISFPVSVIDINCSLKLFTTHFPRADIHKMLFPNLLHQVIKGAFKDHIVNWVQRWLVKTHGEAHANRILEDIDER